MPQEFRFSKNVTTLINIPLGGLFAMIQALFFINGLLWLAGIIFATDINIIFWLICFVGIFICAFFTSLCGLLELKWSAVIMGTIAGLVFVKATGEFTQFQLFFSLFTTTLATYIFSMFPEIKLKKPDFINNLNIIIAGHVFCDIIVMISLFASIWVGWIRPFVLIEILIIILAWYILGGCPFTVVEVKLNDSSAKKIIQHGFLVYYGRSYLGLKIDELKFETMLDHVFYVGTAIIFLLWFVLP
ncbi:hypothetical protein A3A95_01690 [Candidatus Nomurabacteria bacterium RIFCSPLOWO2_01_FULL_39_18]|uniref:Uncharacterized protein n=1 Tax=Candidatus Nomurabacteria bacterium RIFCSPHIGHO2_01_FULL_40_24b TaxID=1801739 RepID=A0A1F6V9S2_9BACT|nr:MAG: hypothetical protein A2647_01030 [Candidatus Nomurabacteria bacterium RIFCSPHIGHO2_01_FULL_40_24b]OGI90580.1 MAG: hypothetical protein A3A95_01690 [Candidatus Nomurabacteria bacterium RIFCSPLOWO2_01_FULL_39_18]